MHPHPPTFVDSNQPHHLLMTWTAPIPLLMHERRRVASLRALLF